MGDKNLKANAQHKNDSPLFRCVYADESLWTYHGHMMFFHGSGPKTEEEGDFDKNASIGLAWSFDLSHWEWTK